jgi:hypothetical protein
VSGLNASDLLELHEIARSEGALCDNCGKFRAEACYWPAGLDAEGRGPHVCVFCEEWGVRWWIENGKPMGEECGHRDRPPLMVSPVEVFLEMATVMGGWARAR